MLHLWKGLQRHYLIPVQGGSGQGCVRWAGPRGEDRGHVMSSYTGAEPARCEGCWAKDGKQMLTETCTSALLGLYWLPWSHAKEETSSRGHQT